MTWKESGVMERFWKWKNFWLNKTVCIRLLIKLRFTVKLLCKLKKEILIRKRFLRILRFVKIISDKKDGSPDAVDENQRASGDPFLSDLINYKNEIRQILCQGSEDFHERELDPSHHFPAEDDSSRLLYKRF